MSNLYAASRQWATRPDDERFGSLEELYGASRAHYDSARTALVKYGDLRVNVVPDSDDVQLAHVAGTLPLTFTDYSFKQLASRVGLGADTLAQLPATITADALNFGLQRRALAAPENQDANILFHKNGTQIFRAITGKVYERIWNWEVAQFLIELRQSDPNWRIPPARPVREGQNGTRLATEADVLDVNSNFGLSVRVGDPIAPAGVYASSSEMFAFLVNQARTLEAAPGGKETLNRGFFVRNSEVGDGALAFTTFKYVAVCGNHILMDVSEVANIRFAHVGETLRARVAAAMDKIKAATDASVAEDEAKLRRLREFLIGSDKEEVIERIQGRRKKKLLLPSEKLAEKAYDLAEEYADIHGDPRSAWGIAAGITRLSQETGYTDKRTGLDRIAGNILQIAAAA